MGRNKRAMLVENNGANPETDSVPLAKKSKKVAQPPPKKEKKLNKIGSKSKSEVVSTTSSGRVVKRSKMHDVYTDTSSSSESDSEKNSVKNDKKSEKSPSDSNSDSDSGSDSDSSGSDSSHVSKTEKEEKKTGKNVAGTDSSYVVNLHPVKKYDSSPKSSASDSYHSDTEEEDKKRRKKQKEMMKIQLNKKNKKTARKKQDNLLSKRDVKQEIDDDMKEEDEDGCDAQVNSDVPPDSYLPILQVDAKRRTDAIDWPQSDVYELIRRMEIQVPEGDNQKFDSRAARLDWGKIAFDGYSKKECQDMWNQISKKIRRFRKLSEMLDDAKEWAKKPWTNFYRGSKKNRHPDMPSKPLSSYMIYYLEQKDKVIEENKGVDLMQVSKIITEKYKNLSDKEREKYSQKANLDKQNFEAKMAEFYKEHPEIEPQSQPKSYVRDSVRGPRKPYPPFKLFFQEELKNHALDGNVDRKALEDSCKEKWRKFSDKKKAEWINRSLMDIERFEKEIEDYKARNPDYIRPNYNKSVINKEERLIMERLSGKPVKPPNSAYSLFSRYMLQSDDDVKSKAPKLRMAEISKKWKEISASEKYRYEEKVKELQDEYKVKLQIYLKSLSPEEREKELDVVKKPKRKGKEKSAKSTVNSKSASVKSKNKVKGSASYRFSGEQPKRPPSTVYELFCERFLAEQPSGMSKEAKLKLIEEHWSKLPDSKKEALRKELEEMKEQFIADFEGYLNQLSSDELKALARKKTNKKGSDTEHINGTLSDSNDDSDDDKCESSSASSDSEDSDSGKSNSSSDDSDG